MQLSYPPHLPVSSHHDEIIDVLKNNQVVIVAGDTGSGKTTQLPKICLELLEESKGWIGCTQPRRIAALTVSSRVAEELGQYGKCVGHKIRFNDRTNERTRIKFMTDGILLAETKNDNLLRKYNFLIIDEAHERSLNIDFLLGYLKKLLPQRPDLKIIITSATIDTGAFSDHFADAPVITIVGKAFPVELRYIPPGIDEFGEYENYIEHCINTVFDLYINEPPGDMLIFMPTEKDIRTCCELLSKLIDDAIILPLFGRLHTSDQKKIFLQYPQTKIVITTNIAETSITVPGIRYVIDTGLARMAYYNFRAKTNSLPIRKISRAGCDQRKGRCGRVAPGICVRLFDEEDYQNREEFTLPEIQRSNLAEVILQMLFYNLGDPFQFPFIDPPHPSAIRDGYRNLHELGAIDNYNNLTKIGRTMAVMPIDPCIARIIIEAGHNNCLTEIKIIGSALAIQDPRVRPAEHEKYADLAHQKFTHPQSDFMSILHIWNLFHNVKEKASWSKLKKFCKSNYLSFQRMREWIDLHEQMSNILKAQGDFQDNAVEASYDDIHKSLAIGFLRNLAVKKQGKTYQGPMGKEIMIFPGSPQFAVSPQWIMAASFLETNRLYALTVAAIQPEWIESLAKPLCKYSWSEPRFQKKSGQVIANEKVTLFGLVIVPSRTVNFGRTNERNRKEARSIFLQSALVDGGLNRNYDFLSENFNLIEKWQNIEQRIRSRDIVVSVQVLYLFYDQKLPEEVYDQQSLNRFLKDTGTSASLKLTEGDILNRKPEGQELSDFPSSITVGSHNYPLTYVFDPLSSEDGITVIMPYDLAVSVDPQVFEWLVPGFIKEKTTYLLKGLPKRIRKHLIPLNIAVDKILDDIEMYKGSYLKAMQHSISKQFNISIHKEDWPTQLPCYLSMRFSLFDRTGREIAQGRDLSMLLAQERAPRILPQSHVEQGKLPEIAKWENLLVKTWDFQGLPDRIPQHTPSGVIAGYLYPVITPVVDKGAVTITFQDSELKAKQGNRTGIQFLYRLQFSQQFKDIKKFCVTSLSAPSSLWLSGHFPTRNQAVETLLSFALQTVFHTEDGIIPRQESFNTQVARVREDNFFRLAAEICNVVFTLLRRRKEIYDLICHYRTLAHKSKSHVEERYQEYNAILLEILPQSFLSTMTFQALGNCDRYLRSLGIRIERAHADFAKDQKKADLLEPHINRLRHTQNTYNNLSKECMLHLVEYEEMVQEMRISLFSPEIKTLFPVSLEKLTQCWKNLSRECG